MLRTFSSAGAAATGALAAGAGASSFLPQAARASAAIAADQRYLFIMEISEQGWGNKKNREEMQFQRKL
jgi:hypothetical protein